MSTHAVEVVPVVLQEHPNADSLSIVQVWGYTCVVRTADFKNTAVGAYIPPDSLVDAKRPWFKFLADKAKPTRYGGKVRIRVSRLRGVISQGLLLSMPPDTKVGIDVMERLGVEHYEPPLQLRGGDDEAAPGGYRPTYDVEGWRRYGHLFKEGEQVIVTEKIHGANARFCWHEGRMRAGSRTRWKAESDTTPWWIALRAHPEIAIFCEAHPNITVYGEIYGQVQDLRYGVKSGVRAAVFDLLFQDVWLGADHVREIAPDLPWVPTLFRGQYWRIDAAAFAEGPSQMPGADHVREGCVIKPLCERTDPELGRVQLKIVGNGYMERKG